MDFEETEFVWDYVINNPSLMVDVTKLKGRHCFPSQHINQCMVTPFITRFNSAVYEDDGQTKWACGLRCTVEVYGCLRITIKETASGENIYTMNGSIAMFNSKDNRVYNINRLMESPPSVPIVLNIQFRLITPPERDNIQDERTHHYLSEDMRAIIETQTK